ncbi:STAM-binding protein-like isoform X2 [Palaemon carinicauda]|uniref:STAM-binding protein-like isoform X2 n=1 Tax=Palaemon carinicauda TaxID=392227 RepID=UPI0035B60761
MMSQRDFSHLEPGARIKQLCTQGNDVVVDPNIPLRRYFRSGLEMVRMANVYAEEGSLESAFILYMKFMTLFLEKIRSHPEFSGHSSIDKTNNTKKLKEILPKAENLKAMLREKYQQEYNVIVKEQKKLEEELKLKQLEQLSQAQEEERRRQLLEEENKRKKEIRDEEKRIKDLQSFHHSHPKNAWSDAPPDYNSLGTLIYPTSALTISDGSPTNRPSAPLEDFSSPTTSPLVSPSSYIQSLPSVPSRDLKPLHPSIPAVDRSSKPTSLLSATNGAKIGGLREVVVPVELMPKFMNLAQANTLRNIETCGVLAGRLAQNQLLLTHLLVPKQCGTSDSCTTQQEEELFDYQDKFDLITIGWIHTHPTQTAFLSSVDLHTHCSYQLMMPEAVAIVCAPKYEETGYFTLTPNHGLSFIANCQESGFHPHPKEPPLFQKADHVTLDQNLPITVIDLRES